MENTLIASGTETLSEATLSNLHALLTPTMRQSLESDSAGREAIQAREYMRQGFKAVLQDIRRKLANGFDITIESGLSFEERCAQAYIHKIDPAFKVHDFGLGRLRGTMRTKVTLVPFDRRISTPEACKELNWLGLRPAAMPHLLTLAPMVCFKSELPTGLEMPRGIVALGSSIRIGRGKERRRTYPMYYPSDSVLKLHSAPSEGWYERSVAFAAVPKNAKF